MNCSYIQHIAPTMIKDCSRLLTFGVSWVAKWKLKVLRCVWSFFTREPKSLPLNFLKNLFSEISRHEWQRGSVPLFIDFFLKRLNFSHTNIKFEMEDTPSFIGAFGEGWTNLETDSYDVSSATMKKLLNLHIVTTMLSCKWDWSMLNISKEICRNNRKYNDQTGIYCTSSVKKIVLFSQYIPWLQGINQT